VRKRESLLKSIYERRKGEGWLFPWGKLYLLLRCSSISYPKKNNKNITRASKNKILATAHASFGNPFTFKTANFVPKEARGSSIETAPVFSLRLFGGKKQRFFPSNVRGAHCPPSRTASCDQGGHPPWIPRCFAPQISKTGSSPFLLFTKARDVC
jgi:hypothetical protein